MLRVIDLKKRSTLRLMMLMKTHLFSRLLRLQLQYMKTQAPGRLFIPLRQQMNQALHLA